MLVGFFINLTRYIIEWVYNKNDIVEDKIKGVFRKFNAARGNIFGKRVSPSRFLTCPGSGWGLGDLSGIFACPMINLVDKALKQVGDKFFFVINQVKLSTD